MQKFFITSTGTGIGKTLVTTTLCYQLQKNGRQVAAIKPVISGYDASDTASDTALILASLGAEVTAENVEKISPWRFSRPLSPDMAAAIEGKKIDLGEVVAFFKNCEKQDADILIAEGAGGVCVPLNEKSTMLDLMAEIDFKIILVAGSYLGSISHTLTALNALSARGIAVHALIINESENNNVGIAQTQGTIMNFIPEKTLVVTLERLAKMNGNNKLWENMPDISKICS